MTPGQRKIQTWRENPAQFVHENLGVDPDFWQIDLLNSFASQDPNKIRISLQACAGPGKTAGLAWCTLNFLSCYGAKGEHPKAAAVSITSDNLSDNFWPELYKWQSRSPFLTQAFTWTKTRFFATDHPETWFIAARSFAKSANSEEIGRTLSGLHSKYVLYIIDESGDIPPAIIKSAEQGLSTKPVFGKILQAGNPTSHEGMLYAASSVLSHLWYVIRITGDPDDPKRSQRIDIDWAREQIKTYGRDNPWVMAYILGQFPPSSINTLLSPDEVRAAMERHYSEDKYNYIQKRLGVDVARFGDDNTVLTPRQGLACFPQVILKGMRNPDIAARIMKAHEKWGHELEFVDGTGGFGAGVVDCLLQAGRSPREVHFSSAAIDPKYYNKRSEMYFKMAEWIKRGGSLPFDQELIKELTAPTYTFQKGKFKLEEKDQIKKRLGFSPDRADSLALTFELPDQPASITPNGEKLNKLKSDFDPLAS